MDGDIYWPITTLRCDKVWAQHELKTMTVDAYKGRKELCTRVFNKMRKYRGEDDFLLLNSGARSRRKITIFTSYSDRLKNNFTIQRTNASSHFLLFNG